MERRCRPNGSGDGSKINPTCKWKSLSFGKYPSVPIWGGGFVCGGAILRCQKRGRRIHGHAGYTDRHRPCVWTDPWGDDFQRPLLTLLNTPDESFEYTVQYVTVCAWGNFFICGYNSLSGVLRGCVDSKHPMYFVTIACLVDIALDFLLVKDLGMAGTVLATVISQAVSLRALVYLFPFRSLLLRMPLVSGIMACYTLAYIIWKGRKIDQ